MATTKVSTKLLETVGVAEGGTGATSASAARTSLGLVIGTNVLAPNGSGSSLTGIATGATDAEKTNIMVNAFNTAVNGGFSQRGMVDGVVDTFTDATGIDTGTSTNETLSSGHYWGQGPESQISRTAGTVFGDMTSNAGIAAAFDGTVGIHQSYGAVKDGVTADVDYYVGKDWGSGNNEVITRYKVWSSTDRAFAYLSGNVIFKLWGSNSSPSGANDGTLLHTSPAFTEATASYEVTSGITLLLFRYTWTTMQIDAAGGNNIYLSEVEYWSSGTPPNMTLVSNATTALATPTDVLITIHLTPNETITLNTDIKAYGSRNGGSNWTQITLSEDIDLTTDKILTGTVSVAGQPSGTSMKYKIECLNNKNQYIQAVGLEWA